LPCCSNSWLGRLTWRRLPSGTTDDDIARLCCETPFQEEGGRDHRRQRSGRCGCRCVGRRQKGSSNGCWDRRRRWYCLRREDSKEEGLQIAGEKARTHRASSLNIEQSFCEIAYSEVRASANCLVEESSCAPCVVTPETSRFHGFSLALACSCSASNLLRSQRPNKCFPDSQTRIMSVPKLPERTLE